MSEHRGSGNRDSMPKNALLTAATGILVAVILVSSGAWDKVAAITGIGNAVGSTQALKPGPEDMEGNSLHLPELSQPSQTQQPESGQIGTEADQQGQAAEAPDRSNRFIPAATSPVPIDQALQDAKALPAAKAHPQGYSRERDFGTWTHAPGMCGAGTTRDLILKRDLRDVVSDERCKVRSGTFDDPYTGTEMRFQYGRNTSGEIQIDHVVALKDAWTSGLWQADHSKRVAYANDPDVLLASNGKQNMAKSDGLDYTAVKDPVWLPANRSWHCDYMAKRVEIKRKYGLSTTPAEKTQTVGILTSCAAGSYQ